MRRQDRGSGSFACWTTACEGAITTFLPPEEEEEEEEDEQKRQWTLAYDQPYTNQTGVKTAINAPLDVDWAICSNKSVFVGPRRDTSLRSAVGDGPMGRVVEKTSNVIVGHGALDMVLILNGSLLTLNNLARSGAQGFTAAPTKPFYVLYHVDTALSTAAGPGMFGSWQEDRGLTFVTIALRGHEVPQFPAERGVSRSRAASWLRQKTG